jgi:hypothetical protein
LIGQRGFVAETLVGGLWKNSVFSRTPFEFG